MKATATFVISAVVLALGAVGCGDPGDEGQVSVSGGGSGGGGSEGEGSEGGSTGGTETFGEDSGSTSSSGGGGEGISGGGSGGEGTSEGGSEGEATGSGSGGIVCVPHDEVHILNGVPASVMLVLDKSGSMAWTWDHDVDPGTPKVSKWNSLFHVVEYMLGAADESLLFGAQLFPASNASGSGEDACLIDPASPEVGVATGNGDAILATIPAADATVRGGTPASKGFMHAIEHLVTLDASSPKYVILVTDGAANCKEGEEGSDLNTVYDDTFPGLVGAARQDHGILTYAIGIDIVNEEIPVPEVNPWESINAVATAGGAPLLNGSQSFYAANNEIQLAQAMETITGHIECTVPLDLEPEYPELVTVALDGVPIEAVTDCENEDGWIYTSEQAPFTAIQLCGSACDQHKLTAEIAIDMACPE